MPDDKPQFPQHVVNLTAQGLVIQTTLLPGLTYSHLIPVEMMDQIAKQWIEARTAAKQQELAVLRTVKASRND